MSRPRRRSRSGFSPTSARSSPTRSPAWPVSSSAASRSSVASSRSSSSRSISPWAKSSKRWSASAGPRHSASAAVNSPRVIRVSKRGQAGGLLLQGLVAALRRLVAPADLDERVHGHGLRRPQRERDEQTALLDAFELDVLPAAQDLQGPQQFDLDPGVHSSNKADRN